MKQLAEGRTAVTEVFTVAKQMERETQLLTVSKRAVQWCEACSHVCSQHPSPELFILLNRSSVPIKHSLPALLSTQPAAGNHRFTLCPSQSGCRRSRV